MEVVFLKKKKYGYGYSWSNFNGTRLSLYETTRREPHYHIFCTRNGKKIETKKKLIYFGVPKGVRVLFRVRSPELMTKPPRKAAQGVYVRYRYIEFI